MRRHTVGGVCVSATLPGVPHDAHAGKASNTACSDRPEKQQKNRRKYCSYSVHASNNTSGETTSADSGRVSIRVRSDAFRSADAW